MTDAPRSWDDVNGTAHLTAPAQYHVAALQAKAVKQRQEIARLTALCETLQAEKAALRFDLNKARAAIRMGREEG